MLPDTAPAPPENSTTPLPTNELLRVTGLGRRYGRKQAVHDITFSVQRGQIVGLLGPNGAGKSTIMKIISGILPASEGLVSVQGQDLMRAPLAARRHIGFLPEQPPLYEDLTVNEYLRFCAALRRVRPAAIDEAVAAAKTACALMDMGGRLVNNLSKGYRQRLGLAQAIIHNPPLLVLDEPTVGLDPIQINEIRTLIQQLGKTRGIILSTHILTEAQRLCNQVLIIHRGRLAFSRSMDESDETGYITRLLNPPAESELAEKLRANVRRLDDGRFLIRSRTDKDIGDRLVSMSVKQGWRLAELMPETDALETLFLRITQTEMP